MKIVVPKETYALERRVVVLPASVKPLVEQGHQVFVQSGAGSGIDVHDNAYKNAGAVVIADSAVLYAEAQTGGMVVKLKAPSAEEFSLMRAAILFCMLHIDQNRERLYHLGSQDLVGVAMEEIRDERDKRLVDQTDITGMMGVYYAIRHFQKVPEEMRAVILGYGNVATGAITACAKLGMRYKIMRRRELKNIPLWLRDTDLLVNAISWPERQREKQEYLVTREDIRNSSPDMIILDLSVDFPSPIETLHPTTYATPFYLDEGRVHISIYGYPGLVPVTSSRVYSEQLLPLVLTIANNGGVRDIRKVEGLGQCIHAAVVEPSRYEWQRYRPLYSEASRIE